MDNDFNRVLFEEMLRQTYRNASGKKATRQMIEDLRLSPPKDGYLDPSMNFLWLGWCAAHELFRSAPVHMFKELSPQSIPPANKAFLGYYEKPGKYYMLRMTETHTFCLAHTPAVDAPVPMPDPSHWMSLSENTPHFEVGLVH